MIITTFVETLDGSWIYCYICCILSRASNKGDFALFFVKIWIPINGTQQHGIGLPEIHMNFAG